jgi:ribosomal protein S18 acetylase RimI-like enzyme
MEPNSSAALSALSFRPARIEETDFIVNLVNSAYRGESSKAGWTTEADLLDGQRTDPQEIMQLIQDENSVLLLCLDGDEIIGSVNLQRKGDEAYLGMFVVRPTLQGAGVGKQFIQAAEDFVRQEWQSQKMTMSVITVREELIAYYERRGYRRTGEHQPFPKNVANGVPKVENLEFEILEKNL